MQHTSDSFIIQELEEKLVYKLTYMGQLVHFPAQYIKDLEWIKWVEKLWKCQNLRRFRKKYNRKLPQTAT